MSYTKEFKCTRCSNIIKIEFITSKEESELQYITNLIKEPICEQCKNITTTNDKKEIPAGYYCYSYQGNTKILCPYWQETEKGARCNLLQINSVKDDPSNLVWDQVKECNINEKEM